MSGISLVCILQERSCRFSHGVENMVEINGGGVLVRKIEELYVQQQNKRRDIFSMKH